MAYLGILVIRERQRFHQFYFLLNVVLFSIASAPNPIPLHKQTEHR